MFEKESNAWIQNNRFIEKLEIDLKIIELEKENISAEHSILTNLIKERLGNIKLFSRLCISISRIETSITKY